MLEGQCVNAVIEYSVCGATNKIVSLKAIPEIQTQPANVDGVKRFLSRQECSKV